MTASSAFSDSNTAQITRRDSGLIVATTAMPHASSLAIGIWISAGSRDERESEHGIAHMLEHMAFKGTESRDAETIARQVEDIGGFINAHTSRQETAYYIRLLPEHLSFGLDMLVDILTQSTLPDHEIVREKGVIIQEIGQAYDTPDDIVFDQFQSLCYPQHAVGRPILGTTDSVNSFQRNDLATFMERYYGASNMVLSVAGQIDHDDLLRHVDAIEAKLLKPVDTPERHAPKWPDHAGKRQDILIRELEQTHLVFGWPVQPSNDHDRFVLRALAILYGGGMSSRLFQEIREKRGLCYSVFAFGQTMSDYGNFGVYAGTDADDGNELITVAFDQLADLAQKTGADECERAKAQMRSSVLMQRESVMNICEAMPREWWRYGGLKDAASYLDMINSITCRDIERMSSRILAEYPVMAAIGDRRANMLMSTDQMDTLAR